MKPRKKADLIDELLDDSFDRAQTEEAKRQAVRDGALVGGRLPTREEVGMRDLMTNLKRRGVLVCLALLAASCTNAPAASTSVEEENIAPSKCKRVRTPFSPALYRCEIEGAVCLVGYNYVSCASAVKP